MRAFVPIRSHLVPGQHDLSIAVHEWSEGDDPVLLLHGFGLSARVWDFVVPALAECHRVIAPDMRGHGDSAHDPEFRYHHINIGRDLGAVMDALALESVSLVAHSFAGLSAIGFAARYPTRVRSLVLVDASAELSRGGGDRSRKVALDFRDAAEFESLLERLHPHADPVVLQHIAPLWLREREDGRWIRKLDPTFYLPKTDRDPEHRQKFDRKAWAEKEEQGILRDLAQIACPALVIRGADSRRFSRATQDRMTGEVMPNARGCEIAGAGHNIMLDQPEALGEVLASFLDPGRDAAH